MESFEKIEKIYHTPLLELVMKAGLVHREHHIPGDMQVCSLISLKTGGCTEDCSYCAQSAKYNTDIKVHKLLKLDHVMKEAINAKDGGANRFCMGAAWRELRDNRDFEEILQMVESVSAIGLEVCCSLGMLTSEQARQLKAAGLTSYNHNLDTSENYYSNIISTRTYSDRMKTLSNVRDAGIKICSGGILGLGESTKDRISMISTFASLPEPPESIPVNILIPIKGTPMENLERISIWEIIRFIATLRVVVPESKIRLAAGRSSLSSSEQALCFLAGANSVFSGEKLLTTTNTDYEEDKQLFNSLGLRQEFNHEASIT